MAQYRDLAHVSSTEVGLSEVSYDFRPDPCMFYPDLVREGTLLHKSIMGTFDLNVQARMPGALDFIKKLNRGTKMPMELDKSDDYHLERFCEDMGRLVTNGRLHGWLVKHRLGHKGSWGFWGYAKPV